MNQTAYLNELFGKRTLIKILIFFLENPRAKLNQKELKKKLRLAKATATKWLEVLERQNFIEVEKVGVTKLYILNSGNPIVKQLKILNTMLKLTKIKNLSSKFNIKIYLYGSAARGDDVEDSDIDILIIGKIKKEQIIKEINDLTDIIKRPIKIQIFSQQDWLKIAKKDKAFHERVEKDKIEL